MVMLLVRVQKHVQTNAIQFGDLNDGSSTVRGNFDDDRAYHLIEEVGTQPNVAYMTKVRNTDNLA